MPELLWIYLLLAAGSVVTGLAVLLAGKLWGIPVGPHELLLVTRPSGETRIISGGYYLAHPFAGRVHQFSRKPFQVQLDTVLKWGEGNSLHVKLVGVFQLTSYPSTQAIESMTSRPEAYGLEALVEMVTTQLRGRAAEAIGSGHKSMVDAMEKLEESLEWEQSEGIEALYTGVIEVRK